MPTGTHSRHRVIWLFALGYFAFYAPYSALIKLVITGSFGPRLDGFELLPAAVAGTLVSMPVMLLMLGWWKYASIPRDPRVILSGIATAAIIATTTLAYGFEGVSILFTLLLLRGGVLVLAPMVDLTAGRAVRWFSWVALALSLGAVGMAFRGTDRTLTMLAAINIGLYLTGYVLRLPAMTAVAKRDDVETTRRYFVQELLVAMAVLLVVPPLFAAAGFVKIWSSPLLVPALAIGVLYTSLYVFGTLIYLDRRENTFCVPMNRGASLLAGVAASWILTSVWGFAPMPASQLFGVFLVFLAVLFLSPLHHLVEDAWAFVSGGRAPLRGATLVEAAGTPEPRLILFVCSGNTCRSPMAAAIAQAEIALRQGTPVEKALSGPQRIPIRAESAGLTPRLGAPMTEASLAALGRLSIVPRHHEARLVTPQQIAAADAIYCMTAAQREDLLREHPSAAANTHCLDPDGDIPDPIGKADAIYTETARRIQELVRLRFDDLGITA